MSYPPGSPGYPSAQQPTTQFAAPTQQFGKLPEQQSASAPEGPSKLPIYLTAAVAALGFALFVSSFGPLFTARADFFTPTLLDLGVVASLLAALLAGVSLIPKQTAANALVAVLSVLGFLLVVEIVLTVPDGVSIDWGLYLILAFGVVQAIVAVAVLLFAAGVITPPAPKPKYEQQQQQQYGQYGSGPYYGAQQHPGSAPHQQQGHQQQRPGYPTPYGGGGGYQGGPSTGGFQSGPQGGPQGGPPTPPTGFPTYGQPPASNTPTTQVPVQSQPQSQSSSSSQSGPPPS